MPRCLTMWSVSLARVSLYLQISTIRPLTVYCVIRLYTMGIMGYTYLITVGYWPSTTTSMTIMIRPATMSTRVSTFRPMIFMLRARLMMRLMRGSITGGRRWRARWLRERIRRTSTGSMTRRTMPRNPLSTMPSGAIARPAPSARSINQEPSHWSTAAMQRYSLMRRLAVCGWSWSTVIAIKMPVR